MLEIISCRFGRIVCGLTAARTAGTAANFRFVNGRFRFRDTWNFFLTANKFLFTNLKKKENLQVIT